MNVNNVIQIETIMINIIELAMHKPPVNVPIGNRSVCSENVRLQRAKKIVEIMRASGVVMEL